MKNHARCGVHDASVVGPIAGERQAETGHVGVGDGHIYAQGRSGRRGVQRLGNHSDGDVVFFQSADNGGWVDLVARAAVGESVVVIDIIKSNMLRETEKAIEFDFGMKPFWMPKAGKSTPA